MTKLYFNDTKVTDVHCKFSLSPEKVSEPGKAHTFTQKEGFMARNKKCSVEWTRTFYQEWLGALASYASRVLGKWHTSEEVAHETLIHASVNFDESLGDFRSYVFGVLRNKIKRFLERESVRKTLSVDIDTQSSLKTPLEYLIETESDEFEHLSVEEQETVKIILSGRGLRVVSKKQKDVQSLLAQGFDIPQIARKLRVSCSVVRKRIADLKKSIPLIRGTVLTSRERQVLDAAQQCSSNEEIARNTGISSWRVHEILSQIRAKASRIESHLHRVSKEYA